MDTGYEPPAESELKQIEARAAAASKAPWEAFIEGRDHLAGESFIRIGGTDGGEPDMYVLRDVPEGNKTRPAADADLDFIASARQDVPRLVHEIRRLRAEICRIQQLGATE